MGLLDFILGRSRTSAQSNDLPPPQQQGYFSDEEIRVIETSPISGYIENPVGVFRCENRECLTHLGRYIPAPNEQIADVMRCPKCGHWMLHHNLLIENSKQMEKVVRGSAGSRQIYQDALESIPLVERNFTAWALVNPDDTTQKQLQVPAFEVLLDLAPMIFDEITLEYVADSMQNLSLDKYPPAKGNFSFATLYKLREFYESLPSGQVFKQTDLKKEILSFYIGIGEPTWIFYVWSNFGLFEREKVKNRIYLLKPHK
jgi:hypothetical protein